MLRSGSPTVEGGRGPFRSPAAAPSSSHKGRRCSEFDSWAGAPIATHARLEGGPAASSGALSASPETRVGLRLRHQRKLSLTRSRTLFRGSSILRKDQRSLHHSGLGSASQFPRTWLPPGIRLLKSQWASGRILRISSAKSGRGHSISCFPSHNRAWVGGADRRLPQRHVHVDDYGLFLLPLAISVLTPRSSMRWWVSWVGVYCVLRTFGRRSVFQT
jgi:hypothetical protein